VVILIEKSLEKVTQFICENKFNDYLLEKIHKIIAQGYYCWSSSGRIYSEI